MVDDVKFASLHWRKFNPNHKWQLIGYLQRCANCAIIFYQLSLEEIKDKGNGTVISIFTAAEKKLDLEGTKKLYVLAVYDEYAEETPISLVNFCISVLEQCNSIILNRRGCFNELKLLLLNLQCISNQGSDN